MYTIECMPLSVWLLSIAVFCSICNNCVSYDGPIGGSKSIADCINGDRKENSNLEMTPAEMIRKEGYPVEDHVVLTEDGYLLTLNRIPGKSNAPAVLIQHGLLFSAFDWIAAGKNKALAYLLADRGYDVWLGNARGGHYSRCHVNYTTSQWSFWNFSFHEVGMYDLPAEINYISRIQNDITYVGHSMGTTAFFIMASERPDIASKIKAMFGLGPVANFNHVRGLRYTAILTSPFWFLSSHFGNGEIYHRDFILRFITKYLCSLFTLETDICLLFIFPYLGYHFDLDQSIVPLIFAHDPAPSSAKLAVHYGQLIQSGKFRNFDYGAKGNLRAYNSPAPPDYALSKIQVPIGLFYGPNDFLASPKDVKHLYDHLPKGIFNHRVNNFWFNHIDFMWGKNVRKLVFDKLLDAIDDVHKSTSFVKNKVSTLNVSFNYF